MMMMAIYGDMQIWRYMVKWLPYHNPLIHPPPPPPPTRVHKHKTQSLPTHTPPPHVHKRTTTKPFPKTPTYKHPPLTSHTPLNSTYPPPIHPPPPPHIPRPQHTSRTLLPVANLAQSMATSPKQAIHPIPKTCPPLVTTTYPPPIKLTPLVWIM